MQPFRNSTDVSELDRVAYLFGYPISHSLSPLLHSTVSASIGTNYAQLLFESKDIPAYFETIRSDPKFLGSSVTMPHKVAIIPYLDELTPEGRAIGAINTIFLKADEGKRRRFCGTNTDCIGIREAFLQNVKDPTIFRGRPGLVIGGGGTSRAAVYALQTWLGCSPIYMINREKSEVDTVISECRDKCFGESIRFVSSTAEAEKLDVPRAIVSCVPDFPPNTEAEKNVRKILSVMLQNGSKGALLEMCYHPSPNTGIAVLARHKGWQVIPGVEAMTWQGLEQARLWCGKKERSELPVEKVKAAIRAAAQRRSLL